MLTNKSAILYDLFKYGTELKTIKEFPSKECFVSKLKTTIDVDNELYTNVKMIWDNFKCLSLNDLNYLYNMVDVILLNCICKSRFSMLKSMMGGLEQETFHHYQHFQKQVNIYIINQLLVYRMMLMYVLHLKKQYLENLQRHQ